MVVQVVQAFGPEPPESPEPPSRLLLQPIPTRPARRRAGSCAWRRSGRPALHAGNAATGAVARVRAAGELLPLLGDLGRHGGRRLVLVADPGEPGPAKRPNPQ